MSVSAYLYFYVFLMWVNYNFLSVWRCEKTKLPARANDIRMGCLEKRKYKIQTNMELGIW